MKIRTGFVSNSSSSSFCIIGVPIDEDDIYTGKIKWEPGIGMIGGYTPDGIIIQDLTKEKYDILVNSVIKPKCSGSITFVRNGKYYEDGTVLGSQPKDAVVYTGEQAQFEPEIEKFENMFVNCEDEDVDFY